MTETSLLSLADRSDREQRLLHEDVRAMLFPKSARPPSERQLAELRQCLVSWIADIEDALLGPSGDFESVDENDRAGAERRLFPRCWTALVSSGLLSDDPLLRRAMALLFLKRLHRPNSGEDVHDRVQAALARFAQSDDALTADAASKLVAAHLRLRSARFPSFGELPAAVLNMLAWRIVAAHEVMKPGMRETLSPNVAALLEHHDESRTIFSAAEQLAHKLFEARMIALSKPELLPQRQGVILSLAILASAASMPLIDIVSMATEEGMARLALIMRALDYHPREAGRLLGWIAARTGSENRLMVTLAAYEGTAQAAAERLLDNWRSHGPEVTEAS